MKPNEKVIIIGFLPPVACAGMPVEGTVGIIRKGTPPEGKRLVEFSEDYNCTDGGRTIGLKSSPLQLYIPESNLKRLRYT